ncbi:MAG TPA: LEA type 2 family protein [Opitutus sp.]|nr:LEA type 2 family protein [Opitutus sp.]
MKRRSFRPFTALLAAVVCLAGCSSVHVIETSMAANVAGFHPADPNKPEDGGTITLRYINESVASLGFSNAEHKLYLDGTLVAEIANDQPFGIVTVSEITRDLPVHFTNPAYVRQLAGGSSPVVHYRLETKLHQRIENDRNDMNLTAEGSLDLRGTPAQ